ncbi:MAG: antitoxin Xre/MbcA/ParS toxin-binding domain-containing protein [Dehalococcoidia bacterium]
MLAHVFGERSMILAWLKSPHPDLDNRLPMDLILSGHGGAVEGMLANALTGIPS